MLTANILEPSTMLARDDLGGAFLPDIPDEVASKNAVSALPGMLIYKYLAQVQLLARHILPRDATHAEPLKLHEDEMEQLIRQVVDIHGYILTYASRLVDSILQALISTYVRSLTAIYGSASGMSHDYITYAKTVLSELEERVRDRTTDVDATGEIDEKGDEHRMTWYWVRERCSALWHQQPKNITEKP
jgi:hypothetical protein